MATVIDRLELTGGRPGGQPVALTNLGDLAEAVALLRADPDTAVDPACVTSAYTRKLYWSLNALGSPTTSEISIQWPNGELREFDEHWAGSSLTRFEMRFKAQLRRQGVAVDHAAFICAALDEMIGNAQEHAGASVGSLATFEVNDRWWAFSVTDFGRGIPARLRQNPLHQDRRDPDAIATALNRGVSTYQDRGRGMGFAQIFRALADRNARVRIRAGCGLVELTGIVGEHGTGTLNIVAKPPRLGTHVRAGARLG